MAGAGAPTDISASLLSVAKPRASRMAATYRKDERNQ
ncbi:LysE family amino acid efflux protein [Brucella sp. NF 2653]|nr:LysE family amino acid efflux protein [Brucella sp. NF 2653]